MREFQPTGGGGKQIRAVQLKVEVAVLKVHLANYLKIIFGPIRLKSEI